MFNKNITIVNLHGQQLGETNVNVCITDAKENRGKALPRRGFFSKVFGFLFGIFLFPKE